MALDQHPIHDRETRRIRDLALFEHRVELVVPRVRVACIRCGPKLERPKISPHSEKPRLDVKIIAPRS